MDQPPLTFAIPFYSGIHYLPRAIESVLAQSDSSWRALVCDDGSVEGTEELVRSYGDSRIAYFKNPRNLGMAGNWNRCLELAESDLITLLHEDDELEPSYCATLRSAAARHPNAVAFYCGAHVIGDDGRPTFSFPDFIKYNFINPSPSKEIVLDGEEGVRALLKGDFIMAPTLCFRRSRLGGERFHEALKFVLDIQLTTDLLFRGEQIVGLPDMCYRYRRHDNNATSQYTQTLLRFHEESDFYDRILPRVRERGWQRCVRLATGKRIIKLNLSFRFLTSCVTLRFAQAGRELGLLSELVRTTTW